MPFRYLIVWFVAVALGAGFALSRYHPPSPLTPIAPFEPVTFDLRVPSQQAGSLVWYDTLRTDRRGWIAVHELDRGKPIRVLGAHAIAADSPSAGEIRLLRPTQSGVDYAVAIHEDRAPEGEFDPRADPIAEDAHGPAQIIFFAR